MCFYTKLPQILNFKAFQNMFEIRIINHMSESHNILSERTHNQELLIIVTYKVI